jgi:hypothetical protein
VPHSANIDCSSYPPTIEDYESPQRDKLNQLMGPDPNNSPDFLSAVFFMFLKIHSCISSFTNLPHGKDFNLTARFKEAALQHLRSSPRSAVGR